MQKIYLKMIMHRSLDKAWATYISFKLSFSGVGDSFGYNLHSRKENDKFYQ